MASWAAPSFYAALAQGKSVTDALAISEKAYADAVRGTTLEQQRAIHAAMDRMAAEQALEDVLKEQEQLAIKAVRALGLDFGAVDLILADDTKSYVLEVNTGPALETASNLDLYIQAFKRVINGVGELLV